MGGGHETSGNGRFPPAAHLLPLGLIRRGAPFRREHSERAESPPENHENTPTAATKKALTKLEKTALVRFLAQSGGNFAALKKNEKVTDRDNQVRLWQEIFICM